jgi:hypothetical protein
MSNAFVSNHPPTRVSLSLDRRFPAGVGIYDRQRLRGRTALDRLDERLVARREEIAQDFDEILSEARLRTMAGLDNPAHHVDRRTKRAEHEIIARCAHQAEPIQQCQTGAGPHERACDRRLRHLDRGAQRHIGVGECPHRQIAQRKMAAQAYEAVMLEIGGRYARLGGEPMPARHHAAKNARAKRADRYPGHRHRIDDEAEFGLMMGHAGRKLRKTFVGSTDSDDWKAARY